MSVILDQMGGPAWATCWTPGTATQQFGWIAPLPSLWSVLATGPAEGAFWMEQDCSTTPGSNRLQEQIRTISPADGANTFPSAPSDTSHRWAHHIWFKWRFTANPTATDMLVANQGLATNTFQVFLRSDRTLSIKDETGAVLERGTVPLTANTEYVIDMWQVLYDASGTKLLPNHWVVRVLSGCFAGGAATVVDTLHFYRSLNVFRSLNIGDNTTTNFGCKQDFGTVVMLIEDADSPFGQLRAAWYKPTGNGATQTYTAAGGTPVAAVSSAPPVADASVTNYIQGIGGNKELFTATGQVVNGSAVPGASDTPTHIMFLFRESYGAVKGSSLVLGEPTLYDGTNTKTLTGLGNDPGGGGVNGPYSSYYTTFEKTAAGAAWATANLGGGGSENQFGLTNSSTGGTQYVDCLHYFAGWVKSGETLAAAPGPDTTAASLILPAMRGWVD